MSRAKLDVPDGASSVVPGVVAPRRHDRAFILAAAVLVSLLGFGWTLDGYFVGDDFGYVSRFFELPWRKWPSLFAQSWAGDMWGFQLRELRPVTALSFMVEARLWGGNALGFRLTNLALHAGCAAMVGILAERKLQLGAATTPVDAEITPNWSLA